MELYPNAAHNSLVLQCPLVPRKFCLRYALHLESSLTVPHAREG